MGDLPSFPVDDVTLDAVEHALGGSLVLRDGDPDDPVVVGAEYTLPTLLDFLAGVRDDPDGVVQLVDDEDGLLPTYHDPRPHYGTEDVIRALIAEVHRLRG